MPSWTAAQLLPLIHANLDHLRAWEPWAQGKQTLESLQAFTRWQIGDWLEGKTVPTMIRHHSKPAGCLSARIDTWFGSAELGYWLSADQQGHGLVHRAATVLIDHLVQARGVERLEIRTPTENVRSRAVAERLGFRLEGELAAALPLRGQRQDLAPLRTHRSPLGAMRQSATS